MKGEAGATQPNGLEHRVAEGKKKMMIKHKKGWVNESFGDFEYSRRMVRQRT